MRKKISLLLAVLLLLGWYQTIDSVTGTPARIKEHIANARKLEEKEVYEDALAEYKQAQALGETSPEIARQVAKIQLKLGDEGAFLSGCKSLIEHDLDEEALRMLTDYYRADGKPEEIVALLKKLNKEHADNPAVASLWNEYRGSYEELLYSYEEIAPFYGNYAVVKNEEQYGLINAKGSRTIRAAYDDCGCYSGDYQVVPVENEGAWFYLNTKEHKKIVPDDAFEWLGVISEDVAVVKKNGKYGYADTGLNLKTECEWEAASAFLHGVAAVCKAGKWALIDGSFSPVTDYSYEEIKVNAAGICSNRARIFARTKEGYIMLNEAGERVGSDVYEDVVPFESGALTAVCKAGKWGFVNTDGEMALACQYEGAQAFTQGMAAVCQDGKWGYIDTAGEMIIAPVFEAAYPFTSAGTAPVKNGYWYLIRLYAIS